ncbi:hypothetical protein [uncultured Roseovarius sp.]|uniref:hypothetical protein n=1 Tax=uncultured Roseovarius sp. TaxID=293344 RepID=UPI002616F581|nr:hypothetical protein [uncultured Roseovarius sp.]
MKGFAAIGLNLIQQRRLRKGRNTSAGLQVTVTTRGAIESETAIIGVYATKGHLIYHNSHGKNNRYYQTVIEVSGLPGVTLSRLMIDGAYTELGDEEHPDYGLPIIAKRDLGKDHAWIRFYDGTQTAADPTLVAKYSEDPVTPWTEAHVNTGVAYAVITNLVSAKVFPNGAPELRFEISGIPFYDPREDSTVGGDGPQRWSDPATWKQTRNPIVISYNIVRGIALPDGSTWGGDAEAEDVPLASWVAGMETCDIDVSGRRQYQCGFEIHFAEDEPFDVLEELMAACNGQIAEFGGFFYVQVGAPDFAVAQITDDDLLVTDDATKDPFPELMEIYNRVSATFVSPGALWNGKPIDLIRNADWEEDDGTQRTFELELPAVFSPAQAGQLAEDVLRDQRRWRQHAWPLPPDYANLRPLNTVSVTSAWNDYADKLFEVAEIALDPHRFVTVATLRERDPDDFVINPDLEIPDRTSILPVPIPTDAGLPGFTTAATVVSNEDDTIRRPAVAVFWDASEIAETIKGIAIECQLRASEEEVWSGTVLDVERGSMIIRPVSPATNLRVRAKPLADNRRGQWTAWVFVTTGDVRLTQADLSDALRDEITTAFDRHDAVLGDAQMPQSVADLLSEIEQNIAPININVPPRETLFERLVFELPQIRDVSEAVRNIEDRLVELDIDQFGLSRRMTDAGIYIDPETGSVRIAGVEATRDRQSLVEASFDALAATVTLKASRSEVNDAIAAAQLDDADLASLTDLQLRVSDVEVDLDAAEGALTLLSETLTVDEGLVTMTEVTGRLDSVEGDLSFTVNQSEFNDAEARLSDAEVQLDTLDGSGITFAVSDQRLLRDELKTADDAVAEGMLRSWLDGRAVREAAASGRRELNATVSEGLQAEASERLTLAAQVDAAQAQIVSEQIARADADAAFTSAIATEASRIDDNAAAITSEATTRATADDALSSRIVSVEAAADDNAAAITSEATARAGADNALAGSLDVLSAQVGDNDAAIAAEQTARADGDSALAGSLDALSAQVGDNDAAIAAEQTARADGDSAEASARQQLGATLTSDIGAVATRVTNVEATRVTASGAVAAVNQEISASYGDLEAMATATSFAEATADGISSGYVWRLNGQNVLEAVSVADGVDAGPTSTFRIAADYVQITGVAQINTAVLDDLFADTIVVGRLTVTEQIIGLNATGEISNSRRSTDSGALGTAYSTVLTHIANHQSRSVDKNMVLFLRMQVEGSNAAAANVLEYRILRDGVPMLGVPSLKREIRPGEVIQEFFGIKQRTTSGATSTTYTLQARVATNGSGIVAVTVNVGTEMWTEEKSIAGLV